VAEPTDCRRPGPTDEPRGATPTLVSATVASERAYALAEGPLWDEQRERVLWVDINAGHIHSGSVDGSVIAPAGRLSFDETVGAVACSADGALLVAGQRDLYRVGAGFPP
jgi:sugar lactone lactonase YvrE